MSNIIRDFFIQNKEPFITIFKKGEASPLSPVNI